jgi:hypothetical protein
MMQRYFGLALSSLAETPQASHVSIAVQNSTQASPVVEKVIAKLGGVGYGDIYVDQPWPESLTITQIIAQQGNRDEAEAIRQALGFGEVAVESTGNLESDITIRLGEDAQAAISRPDVSRPDEPSQPQPDPSTTAPAGVQSIPQPDVQLDAQPDSAAGASDAATTADPSSTMPPQNASPQNLSPQNPLPDYEQGEVGDEAPQASRPVALPGKPQPGVTPLSVPPSTPPSVSSQANQPLQAPSSAASLAEPANPSDSSQVQASSAAAVNPLGKAPTTLSPHADPN